MRMERGGIISQHVMGLDHSTAFSILIFRRVSSDTSYKTTATQKFCVCICLSHIIDFCTTPAITTGFIRCCRVQVGFVRIFIEIMLARAPGAVEKNWQSAQRNDCCLHATVSQEATFPAVIGRFAISVDFE
jgi:hypothetical protein